MKIRELSQLFSLRDLRNAALGFFVVFGGLGLSLLTYYAHRTGNVRLAGIAAAVSLVFVLLILIFIVPPLARNAGKEASQMNLPFEFTTGGAIILGLIVIVGFSAWNTGNNLLFLVLSFLASAMVVGFLAGNVCLKKLDVKMRFPETIFAGQDTGIMVSLHNRKRLFPSYSVIAEVRGKEREKSVVVEDLKKILPKRLAERLARPPVVRRILDYFVHVPRRQTIEKKTDHVFLHRGRFLIQDFELSTRFPFGFFRHRRRLPAQEAELIVFPRIFSSVEELEDIPLEAGKLIANRRGLGQDLLALRDYRPNDDLRRIDWKATARMRELIVREFSAEDDQRITIFLDTRLPREGEKSISLRDKIEAEQKGESLVQSERFESALSLAATIMSRLSEEEAETRIFIDGNAGAYGVGRQHLLDSLRRLAVAEPNFVEVFDQKILRKNVVELVDERENSHNILITSLEEKELPVEITDGFKIIKF
jgi:uncharacterized protein (DUF58 family)